MNFKINYLDHVAIRVSNIEVSAEWYERVLGLSRYSAPEWAGVPLMMMAGSTGIALFPMSVDQGPRILNTHDHFAFNVDNENFEKAKSWFDEIGIEYNLQDHDIILSLYVKDPDGYTVELTMHITL